MTDLDPVHQSRMAAGNPSLVAEATIALTAKCLASAFDDDPVLNWFLRTDQKRAAAIVTLMGTVTRRSMASNWAFCSDDGGAAALWYPPETQGGAMSLSDQIRLLPRFARISGLSRLGRLFRLMDLVEKNHPHDPPHFYLQFMGVDAAHQGKGLGSSILSATLKKIDAIGMPAYLENSKDRNTPFYQRHGFKVMGELNVPGGCPTLWPMWREAQK